jgi:hypothetical protein
MRCVASAAEAAAAEQVRFEGFDPRAVHGRLLQRPLAPRAARFASPRPLALRVLVAAAAALALHGAPARAATVGQLDNPDEDYHAASFAADPGESNNLTVNVAAHAVSFSDVGVSLSVRPPCTRLSDSSARCPRSPNLNVELGDGNDRLRIRYATPVPKLDTYALVNGGRGNDTLLGGAASEELEGGPGADVIDGGGGSDSLTGGEGADVLDGGPGADILDLHDYLGGAGDRTACGPGRDAVNLDLDPPDLLERDCEEIAAVPGQLPTAPTVNAAGAARYRAPCPRVGNGAVTRCSFHVRLSDQFGHLLADGSGRIRTVPYRGIRQRTTYLNFPVHLTARGRRLLLGHKPLIVATRISSDIRGPATRRGHETFDYRLRWH